MYIYMYTYKCMSFHPHMHLEFYISAAQTNVDVKLHIGSQSLLDYMCISNLSKNIYYYSELGPIKLN